MIINLSNQSGNARGSGQITSNFLTQANWRLYEIRQPPTWLCITSNFLTDGRDGIYGRDGNHSRDGHHGPEGHHGCHE